MFWFISYCIGTAITTGVILGSNAYARELDREEPFYFGGNYDTEKPLKYVTAMALWPIAWFVFAVTSGFSAAARSSKRKALAAQERQRLLEAPIED